MHLLSNKCAVIALLIVGSATLLFSCREEPTPTNYDFETLMTESSENRTIAMIENGKCSYTFSAPLIEGYSMATNPYQEFRRGIRLVTFKQDTITVVADTSYVANQVDAVITANYAIYYEKQDLWEAKGDVVVVKSERDDGDTLVKGTTEVYTQQLYWNAKIGRIYSNVDTRVLTDDGPQFGEGFDTDQELKEIHFRKYIGEVEFDFTPAPRDSVDVAKEDAAKEQEGAPAKDAAMKSQLPKDIAPVAPMAPPRNNGHAARMESRDIPRTMGGAERPVATTSGAELSVTTNTGIMDLRVD